MTNLGNSVQSNIQEGVFTAVAVTDDLTGKEGYLVKLSGVMSGKYPKVCLPTAVGDDPLFIVENGGTVGSTVEVRPLNPNVAARIATATSTTVGTAMYLAVGGKVTTSGAAGTTLVGYAEEDATVAGDVPLVKVRPIPVRSVPDTQWYEGTYVTLTDASAAFEFRSSKTNGMSLGGDAADKIGFYGLTPGVVQPASANQTAVTDSTNGDVSDATAAAVTNIGTLTDSTTGAAGTTLAAGVGVETIAIPITLANIADGDIVTTYTVGYKFKVLSASFLVTTAATTPAKGSTLNLEIGTTNLAGGVITLTSANCTPLGNVVAGTAVTGDNTGSASATISVEASATTTFIEGEGLLLLRIQNMDTADAFASLAAQHAIQKTANTNLVNGLAKGLKLTNALRSALVALNLIKGSA